MAIGPGKYGKEARAIRKSLKARGVILIVFGGLKGPGFDCQVPLEIELVLPKILRHIAAQLEEDSNSASKS